MIEIEEGKRCLVRAGDQVARPNQALENLDDQGAFELPERDEPVLNGKVEKGERGDMFAVDCVDNC